MSLRVRMPAVLLVLWFIGCSTKPDQILVTPTALNLAVGATQQLDVVVLDADGQPIANAPVTFTSGDTAVAKVTAAGLVSGVAGGTTWIRARSDPASTTVPVTVVGGAWLDLVTPAAVLALGETAQLEATVYDADGNPIPTAPVRFESRDPTLITVSATGIVTAVDVGTTYVVATSDAASDSVWITGLVGWVTVGANRVFGVAVSTAGVAYATLPDLSSVVRLDLPTPAVTATIGVGLVPGAVAFNAAGDRAYVGNQSGASVSVVDAASNAVVATLAVNGSVFGVTVAPGDSLLFVATDANRIYYVRLPGLTVSDSVAIPGFSNAMVVRGTMLYASLPLSGIVEEINVGARQVARTLSVGGVPQGLVVPPTGNDLYIANETGKLQIWDLASNVQADTVPLEGGGGFGLARDPANGLLFVSTSYFGSRVHVIDPTTRTVVKVIRTGGVPRRIAFTASSSVGIVTNEGGWIDFIR